MRNFYAETGRAAAKTLYNALTPFLSGIAAFSLKKPLLFATAFLFFAFIAGTEVQGRHRDISSLSWMLP